MGRKKHIRPKKICEFCNREFSLKYPISERLWPKRRFCSNFCRTKLCDEKHWHWKGNNVGYRAIHQWLKRNYGLATRCENCGKTGIRKNNKWTIEWALLKGKNYMKQRDNYWMLCISCHRKYDKKEFTQAVKQ